MASDWLEASPEIIRMVNGSDQMKNIQVSRLAAFFLVRDYLHLNVHS